MTGRPANCGTASSRCSPTLACRLSRSHTWSDTAGLPPPRRSTESRSGQSSSTVLMSWTGSFQAGLTGMLSYSLSYSAPTASRFVVGCKPCDLVGVAGFEPAASSSRTKDEMQASRTALRLTWEVIPQHPSGHLSGTHALDASVTHADSAALGHV